MRPAHRPFSIGEITNGRDIDRRPGALYLSTNIPPSGGIESTWGGAGWVEVNYGQGGNVSDYTVHGQCQDRVEPSSCSDAGGSLSSRITNFQTHCTCATEQRFPERETSNRVPSAGMSSTASSRDAASTAWAAR